MFECETVDLPITVRSPQRWGVDEPEAPTVVATGVGPCSGARNRSA